MSPGNKGKSGAQSKGKAPRPDTRITRIIGLMSGTSHDGVDAALVEFPLNPPLLKGKIRSPPLEKGGEGGFDSGFSSEINITPVRHIHVPYSKQLRDEIRMAFSGNTELICRLNFTLGNIFAKAVFSLLKDSGFRPEDIDAVASHGQTIYHIPPSGKSTGSTLQIGEASVISERTGILTLSDFRTADMAAGGHGAPLVPMADFLLFSEPGKVRAVLNIGGIANVTIVRDRIDDTVAFDIGPGNSLIDEAMLVISKGGKSFDKNGAFARKGELIPGLLKELLSHPYFRKTFPKSTGRETFGTTMLKYLLNKYGKFKPNDIVSTLTHLTAATVYNSIANFKPDEIILTGGGVNNCFLTGLINDKFKDDGVIIRNISEYGIPAQAKEAMSFAILGYQTLNRKAGNIPSVTGARHGVILGKITTSPHMI
ncbi:MAG: anhydro-N-acetylmuramic acid kinase [Nitrospirae bacterium]|nr:anhydro-N-acetylmuramic acid kinase [Nitrospirota bacterium]